MLISMPVCVLVCVCVCNNRCVFIISMQIVLPVWLTPITSINRWFRSLQSTPYRSQDPNSFTIVLRPFTFAAISISFSFDFILYQKSLLHRVWPRAWIACKTLAALNDATKVARRRTRAFFLTLQRCVVFSNRFFFSLFVWCSQITIIIICY